MQQSFKHTPHRVGNIGDVPVICVKCNLLTGCTGSRVSSTLQTVLAALRMYVKYKLRGNLVFCMLHGQQSFKHTPHRVGKVVKEIHQ